RKIWREKTLAGLESLDKPLDKIMKLLGNYRDSYLKDNENFPGGCLFIALAVELDHRRPALAREVYEGFIRLKNMITRLLDQAKAAGQIKDEVDTGDLTEMIFSGMLGASVMYGLDQSSTGLDRTIDSLLEHIKSLSV
ncbi:MAG: TetR family transcriptional regulator C-terminal domain-containing protein, partial [Pseudomonadota bacterium]